MHFSLIQIAIFFLSFISLAGTFVCLIITLYLAYFSMELALKNLSNCTMITSRVFLLETGLWGRFRLMCVIMGLLAMPGFFLSNGGASIEDIKKFPRGLKKKLVLLQWLGWGFLMMMLCMALVIEFCGMEEL